MLDGKGSASELSWWPKAKTWNASPYNVGYWSADAEAFCQDWMGEIAKGAGPKSNTAWINELKKKGKPRPVRQLRDKMATLCHEFIKGNTHTQ
jgi:hypothetical protein